MVIGKCLLVIGSVMPSPLRCTNSYVRKNQPFLTNKANFRKSQMNITKEMTREYENETLSRSAENKANTKPIQSQTKPISPPHASKQTQFKPKTNPNKPNFRGKKCCRV